MTRLIVLTSPVDKLIVARVAKLQAALVARVAKVQVARVAKVQVARVAKLLAAQVAPLTNLTVLHFPVAKLMPEAQVAKVAQAQTAPQTLILECCNSDNKLILMTCSTITQNLLTMMTETTPLVVVTLSKTARVSET